MSDVENANSPTSPASENEKEQLVDEQPIINTDNEMNDNDNENDSSKGSTIGASTPVTSAEVGVDDSLLSLVEKQQHDTNNDNVSDNVRAGTDPDPEQTSATFCSKVCDFYTKNSFLILVILAILLAYAYPPLGSKYLYPQYTATWVAVVIIFFLSGISLKSEEFKNALTRLRFNIFVQLYNFGFVSIVVFAVSRLVVHWNIITRDLADGMVIGSCVPITVNMVMVLTKSSNGDEASAIFNAAFGNLLGVFISPLLILLYLGQESSIDIGSVLFKLSLRVLLPIFVGQLIHMFSATIVSFVKEHKKKFKKIQEYCLIFIVYTVFCRTFYPQRYEDTSDTTPTTLKDAVIMIIFQFILLVSVMTVAWFLLTLLYPRQPALRVMGLYGCTHKSVAMGIPLINAIYEDNPNIGFYTLPLLIWHPMQLVIGTFLSPRLASFVTREKERLSSEHDIVDQEEN